MFKKYIYRSKKKKNYKFRKINQDIIRIRMLPWMEANKMNSGKMEICRGIKDRTWRLICERLGKRILRI